MIDFALVTDHRRRHAPEPRYYVDFWLVGAVAVLLVLGLIMMGSASISVAQKELQEPFYYIWRQLAYVCVGLLVGWAVLYLPTGFWNKISPYLLLCGFLLLIAVLPLGREVNGSVRWIDLGLVNLQPSELMKLFTVLYLASYLVRRGEEVRTTLKGFLKPLVLVAIIGGLLLLEPDFGAGVVIATAALGMMFLGGVRVWQFGMLILLAGLALVALAYSSPYRIARLTSFVNPWTDPFNSEFQLTQALIAFGRGEWLGVGLGESVQKLFYLPEAHTDFLFAVISEELGLLGGMFVVGLFSVIVFRALRIGQAALRADDRYAGYLAYGLGMLVGLQAFTNIGVNMGVLPTKGLTLPLMSYGGSSIVVTCVICAILLRIAYENQVNPAVPRKRQRTWPAKR